MDCLDILNGEASAICLIFKGKESKRSWEFVKITFDFD